PPRHPLNEAAAATINTSVVINLRLLETFIRQPPVYLTNEPVRATYVHPPLPCCCQCTHILRSCPSFTFTITYGSSIVAQTGTQTILVPSRRLAGSAAPRLVSRHCAQSICASRAE